MKKLLTDYQLRKLAYKAIFGTEDVNIGVPITHTQLNLAAMLIEFGKMVEQKIAEEIA